MKRALSVLVIAACISVMCVCESHASAEQLVSGMGNKLWRGIVNTFTGWIELPMQIAKGYEKDNVGGAFVGIFTGVWHGVGRTLSGFGDMAGFWAADPANNDGVGIPLDAEYAWEQGDHYSLTDPSFGEATLNPIGSKLGRGLGQAIFGFVEFPGQILKGIKAKAYDLGIIKGLWYWFSREVDGVYDFVTFPLPNPKDTKALPYDEKWPWSALGDSMK